MGGLQFTSEAPSRHVYALAALLGLAAYVTAYGPAHAFGYSDYWQLPQQDERMALMGYRYFLLEKWHWPVFVSHAVNVPYPKSVAFLDCIPLWALVNKGIATVVPPWREVSSHGYLAMWHALAYALQPVFGVAIMRALGHRQWREALVTAVFFVAIPPWIYRYGHPALSAHWIELWAVLLYVQTPRGAESNRLGGVWLCQLAIAALTTPYHVVICLPIFVASIVRARRRTALLWIPVALVCIALLLWFAGYFGSEGRRPQWGFEYESANALGWLVPQHGAAAGVHVPHGVDATGFQYEGYAYLGAGFLGLLAALLVRRELEAGRAIRNHALLFAFTVGFCVLALSNRIFVGSHELVTYPVPRVLEWFAHQYRSPGRFVWLPLYVACCYLLHRGFATASSPRRWLLVAALAGVQLIGATADWAYQRSQTDHAYFLLGHQGAWRALVHAHRRIFVLPTYPCVPGEDGAQQDVASMELQWLASERAMPINGTYSARPRRYCAIDERGWATMELQPDALYVALTPASAVAERFEVAGAACGAFRFGSVCSANRTAIARAFADHILETMPAPIAVTYGQPLAIANVSTNAAWGAPEDGGRWMIREVAGILLRATASPPEHTSVRLHVRSRLCPLRPERDIDVRVNGALVTMLHFDASTNDAAVAREISLSDRAALAAGAFALQFTPHEGPNEHSPIRCSTDFRDLGLWVSDITFEAAP